VIRIVKPRQAPDILISKGGEATKRNKRTYTRFSQDYKSGLRSFKFNPEIYGHKTIKQALVAAQNEKCCFCESKIRHISYGDVEHFRPKRGYRQEPGDILGKPGYYWLVYSKEISFLSHARHHDDLGQEEPLFINPASENPEQYLSFRKEVAYAISDNQRGKVTIECLGLNRAELREVRWDYYKTREALFNIVQIARRRPDDAEVQELARQAQAILNESTLASAAYSLMFRQAITDGFRL
jgi:hypothetical protein